MGVHSARLAALAVHRSPFRDGGRRRRRISLPDMPFSDVPSSIPASLLETQAVIVSAAQLTGSGVSIELAKKRARAGRWQRIHRGVFAVFSGPVNRQAQVWAALLRCGTGATASHVTAAELEALCERVDERVHVTIPAHRRVRGRYEGIVVHHAHRLGRSRHPTRLPRRTRVEATVLDLVDVSETAREVEAWIVAACQKRLTTPTRLGGALAERKKITWRGWPRRCSSTSPKGRNRCWNSSSFDRSSGPTGCLVGTGSGVSPHTG